jgi:hypothetical protein
MLALKTSIKAAKYFLPNLRKGKMILDTGTHEYLYCCRTTKKTIPDITVNSFTTNNNTTTTTTTTATITTTTTTTTSITNNNNYNYNNTHCNSKEFSLLSFV